MLNKIGTLYNEQPVHWGLFSALMNIISALGEYHNLCVCVCVLWGGGGGIMSALEGVQ